MGKRVKLKAGDIFRFHGNGKLTGIGQVIEPGGVLYATILRPDFSDLADIGGLPTEDILFCGWTMDALFYHDQWHVIGNLPIPEGSIPRPCSKVQIGGEIWVQDFRARPLRRANSAEAATLDNHTSRSPKTYVDAYNAHHGLGEWLPRYESFSIERVRKLAAICSG